MDRLTYTLAARQQAGSGDAAALLHLLRNLPLAMQTKHDGHRWLCCTHAELAALLGLETARKADGLLRRLTARGLVVHRVRKVPEASMIGVACYIRAIQ